MNIENDYFVIYFFSLTSYCVQNKLYLLDMSMMFIVQNITINSFYIYSTFKHPEKTSVNI